MKRLHWRTILIATIITVLSIFAWTYIRKNNNEARIQRELTSKIEAREVQLEQLNKANEANSKDKENLQKETQELKKQLEAKRAKQEADRVYAANLETMPVAPNPGVTNCGDNPYKQYIYQHESGCRTGAVNEIGCTGLGQSCPASKIAHCGTDFACQDAWFSNYAITRYGSWEAAYSFWLNNHWW